MRALSAIGNMLAAASLAAVTEARPTQLIPTIFSVDHRRGGFARRYQASGRRYPYSSARQSARLHRQAERIIAKGGKLPWEQSQCA